MSMFHPIVWVAIAVAATALPAVAQDDRRTQRPAERQTAERGDDVVYIGHVRQFDRRTLRLDDGKTLILHPAARIEWSSGLPARAESILVGSKIYATVYDEAIEVPVIKTLSIQVE